jgi:hypothetical protein
MTFGKGLTDSQFRLARMIEKQLGVSISQVVKAFERHEDEKIQKWKSELR